MITSNKKLVVQVEFDYQLSPYKNKKRQDPYLTKFQSLKQEVISNLSTFIGIDVIAKEIPDHYVPVSKEYNNTLYVDAKKNKIVKFPRKQSFEVSLDNFVIFSRLKTGTWPKNKQVIEWLFRVAEKITQVQKIVQSNPQQPKQMRLSKLSYADTLFKQTIDKSNQKLNIQLNNPSSRATRFPSVRQSYSKPIQHFTNRGIPTKQRVRNRYISLRQDKQLIDTILPKGFNKEIVNNYQTLQQPAKYNEKSSRTQHYLKKQTINMNQTYNPANQSFFHWSFEKKNKGDKTMMQNKNSISISKMSESPQAESRVSKYSKNSKNLELIPISPAVNVAANLQKEKFSQNASILEAISEIKDAYKIEIAISNSYLNYFKSNYLINQNYIKKKSNQENWSLILAEHLLPIRGIFYFQLTVFKSKANQIQIGLSPASYVPKTTSNPLDETLVSFNIGTGMIRDNIGKQHQSKTSWRLGGQKTDAGSPISIMVKINMIINKIQWFANQQLVASAKIPLQFANGCRVFLSAYHVQDLILLNSAKKETTQKQLKSIQQTMKVEKGSIKKNIISNNASSIQNQQSQNHEMTQSQQNDYVGQIKYNGSPLNTIKQKLQEKKLEDERKYHELLLDMGMVNKNQGKIKKQRLFKYIQKKEEPKVQQKTEKQQQQQVFKPENLYALKSQDQQTTMVWFATYSTIRQRYLLFQSTPEELLLNYKKIYQPAKSQSQQSPPPQQTQKIISVKNISFKSQKPTQNKNELLQVATQHIISQFNKEPQIKIQPDIQVIEADTQRFDQRNKIIRDISSQKLSNEQQQGNQSSNQQDIKLHDSQKMVKQSVQPTIVILSNTNSQLIKRQEKNHEPQNNQMAESLKNYLLLVHNGQPKEPSVIDIQHELIKQKSDQQSKNSDKKDKQPQNINKEDNIYNKQMKQQIAAKDEQRPKQLISKLLNTDRITAVRWCASYKDNTFKLQQIKVVQQVEESDAARWSAYYQDSIFKLKLIK